MSARAVDVALSRIVPHSLSSVIYLGTERLEGGAEALTAWCSAAEATGDPRLLNAPNALDSRPRAAIAADSAIAADEVVLTDFYRTPPVLIAVIDTSGADDADARATAAQAVERGCASVAIVAVMPTVARKRQLRAALVHQLELLGSTADIAVTVPIIAVRDLVTLPAVRRQRLVVDRAECAGSALHAHLARWVLRHREDVRSLDLVGATSVAAPVRGWTLRHISQRLACQSSADWGTTVLRERVFELVAERAWREGSCCLHVPLARIAARLADRQEALVVCRYSVKSEQWALREELHGASRLARVGTIALASLLERRDTLRADSVRPLLVLRAETGAQMTLEEWVQLLVWGWPPLVVWGVAADPKDDLQWFNWLAHAVNSAWTGERHVTRF